MPPAPTLSDNARGALWLLGSVAGATGMTISVRLLTPEIHSAMLVFLRCSIGLVMLLPVLWRARVTGQRLTFNAWKLHLLRGALFTVALNAGFYAIWQLPLAQATVLFFTAPIFATLLSVVAVGERVGPTRAAAMAAGFAGALIILRPGFAELDPAMPVALVSSMAFAGTLVLGRLIAPYDGPDSTFASTTVIVAVTTLPPALPVWSLPPDLATWAMVGGLMLFATLRSYADIRAYAQGDAGFLAPFTYLRLLTVGLAGYLMFDETPDWATLLGGAVIVAATLTISLREHRRGRRARAAGPP